jgi:hypothetical protein
MKNKSLKEQQLLQISPDLLGHASWLKQYATNLNVMGSIPDEFIGLFDWPNPFSRIMALRSTQPLTEISIRYLPKG